MSDIICGHPGGIEFTREAIKLCGFTENSKLADIGCGDGNTVKFIKDEFRFDITGIDILPRGENIIKAAAEKLPFPENSMDGLIFECSMSKTDLPDAVLNECARVLKSGGIILIHDLYAKGIPAKLRGILGRIETKEQIINRMKMFGFKQKIFEDHSRLLTDMWAQLIFENGSETLCENLGTDFKGLKEIACGYFLAVFFKDKNISGTDRIIPVSPDKLKDYQLKLLKETVGYASKSGFYREHLCDIREIESFEDFLSLPFTAPEDILRDYTGFLKISPDNVKRIVTQTSGTSNLPKRICFTEKDILRTENFFTAALSDYVQSGMTAAVFLSNAAPDGIGDLLRRAFRRIGVDTVISGNVPDYKTAAEIAGTSDFLIGMPVFILRLCRENPDIRPKGVLLSADFIPESIISSIKKTWRCKIIRHFGMTETCFGFASDCFPEGGQHIRHGDFYIELINPDTGKPAAEGADGEIVITTLGSEAFPLIRYRTGDLGCLEYGTCVCGGEFPRLKKVYGRIQNLKNKLNIHALDELMFSFERVLDYRAYLLTSVVEGEEIDGSIIEKENLLTSVAEGKEIDGSIIEKENLLTLVVDGEEIDGSIIEKENLLTSVVDGKEIDGSIIEKEFGVKTSLRYEKLPPEHKKRGLIFKFGHPAV